MSSKKLNHALVMQKSRHTFHKFIYIHNMCIGNHFNRITVDTHMNIHIKSDEKKKVLWKTI